MKVYIVNGHCGQYEDYTEWVAGNGVFLNREMAESFKVECDKQTAFMEELIPNLEDATDDNLYPRYYSLQIPEWCVDKYACYDYTGTRYNISEYNVIEEF